MIPALGIPGTIFFGSRFARCRILEPHLHSPVPIRNTTMSKLRQSNKEPKKQAAMTLKEKKAAKHAKKHAADPAPLIRR